MYHGNGMGTTIGNLSYPTTEAEAMDNNTNVASLRLCSLKTDGVTGARLPGGFTECLAHHWIDQINYEGTVYKVE